MAAALILYTHQSYVLLMFRELDLPHHRVRQLLELLPHALGLVSKDQLTVLTEHRNLVLEAALIGCFNLNHITKHSELHVLTIEQKLVKVAVVF